MQEKKGIAILGSTGSIGTQALDVIESYPEVFDLQVITANTSADLLIEQAIKHQPNSVVIVDEHQFKKVQDALWDQDIHVYAGVDALSQVVDSNDVDTVLTAMVGYAGLRPTLAAIQAKKTIALANKETLVVAGELITKEAQKKRCKYLSRGFGAFRHFSMFDWRVSQPDRKNLPDGIGRSFSRLFT
jgi:1-deoxy-D-xylulose-5-phosphate reductoisomerase